MDKTIPYNQAITPLGQAYQGFKQKKHPLILNIRGVLVF